MTEKKIFNFLTKFFFLTLTISSFSVYSQIYIDNWVHQPDKKNLNAPLIYVDFWATWCAPCISSMPYTEVMEQRFKDKILFVYISNESENKIKSFMSRKNYHFYTANDLHEYNYRHFQINSIPAALILNPDGEVVWQGKPGKLKESTLRNLVAVYGHKKGRKNRIKLQKLTASDENDNLVKGRDFSLKFQKFDYAVPYKFIHKNNTLIYKGDLKSILTEMLQVEPYQIRLPEETSYWEIVFDEQFQDNQAGVAKSFLKSNGFEWNKLEKELTVYQLNDRDTSSWLSSQLYQYAESPEQSLSMVDEYFLTVDNASPKLLARILSEKTPWIFSYKGNNEQIYDWNIRIDKLENLLKNLITDLDFKVKEKTKEVPVYIIDKEVGK